MVRCPDLSRGRNRNLEGRRSGAPGCEGWRAGCNSLRMQFAATQ